ncbi:MAG: hypothetical protein GY822_09920 [Deltaproteobacteria bacterium]|nr:hypothetical protein [Deltaproteobacteria bacterium]
MTKTLIATAALLLLSTSAFAQDSVIQEEDTVKYNKKTVIDFSDVNIEGELTKPEGSYIKQKKKTRFRNLIDMRGNFVPELSRSMSKL